MSPSSIVRSPASWCGLAPFGPEPTTVKSTWEWPWLDAAARPGRRRPRSPCGPAKRTFSDLLEARVGGRPGGGEPLELVGVLDRAQHRQRRGHRDVARCRAAPAGGRAAAAPTPSRRSRTTPSGSSSGAAAAYGSSPSVQSVSAIVPALGAPLGVGPLEHRQDHRRVAVLLDDEQREPLGDGHRHVAGEVEQVGPGRDEDAGQARPRPPARPRARMRRAKSSAVNGRGLVSTAIARSTAPLVWA